MALRILGNQSGQFEKLEVFHLRYIRGILGEDDIFNIQLRKQFNNMKNVDLKIAKR